MTTTDRDVERAITATALDYVEGWFDGDAARMERALHPDLVKRSLAADGSGLSPLTAREMIDATAAGGGRARDPGDRAIDIRIEHVSGDLANVTCLCAVFVDFLQLVRTPAGWRIANVLWGFAPGYDRS